MRPLIARQYTIAGRFGTYTVPTIAAVDARCRTLQAMLASCTPTVYALVVADLDTLLDRRLTLMGET